MRRGLAAGTALLVALSSAASAQAPATRDGFSVARLARVDSALQRWVDRGEMVGGVVLVLRDGHVAYERAVGWADREAGRRMAPDALFRIASQTKAVTSVAVMMLAEEGRLSLGDPVGRFIPAWAHTTVAVRTDTGRAIVPARRAITIRDLLTHTAGLSYGTDSLVAPLYAAAGLGPSAGFGWYTADKDEPTCTTMERLASLPLVRQPGDAFVYGYSTDVLGCVVERASGMPFDRFVAARITGPLGLRDTRFYVPAAERDRLAAVYTRTSDTSLVRAAAGARGQGHYVDGPRRSFSGGAGLTSTARDYARFLEALRRGGALDGVRLLGPRTVALMTSNQTGTLFDTGGGTGFGLGFSTVEKAGAGGRIQSVGSYGWGGAYGSEYLVDPAERMVIVFMTQELPNVGQLGARVPMLVYQALVEPASR